MNIDVSPYRTAHKDNIIKEYKERGIDSIAFYSAVSYCPVLALYVFCREEFPEDEEITRRILSIKKFYEIDKILGEINGERSDEL